MKSFATVLLTSLFLAAAPAAADTFVFTPDPPDLDGLDHNYAFTWGIDVSALAGWTITEAELRIEEITNWDEGENILYLHLLDDAPLGPIGTYDGSVGGDFFSGQGELIGTFTDVNGAGTTEDLSYVFSALGLLGSCDSFAADGVLAVGLDPDCHYWNNGISLIITAEAPLKSEETSWGGIKMLFQ